MPEGKMLTLEHDDSVAGEDEETAGEASIVGEEMVGKSEMG